MLDLGVHDHHEIDEELIAEAEIEELRAALNRIHRSHTGHRHSHRRGRRFGMDQLGIGSGDLSVMHGDCWIENRLRGEWTTPLSLQIYGNA